MADEKIKYVTTNIGVMPLKDYYEIMAQQYGFSSYEEMREEGLCIDVSEDAIIEK